MYLFQRTIPRVGFLVVLAVARVCTGGEISPTARADRVVYFQVTSTDGQVRDAGRVPAAKKG